MGAQNKEIKIALDIQAKIDKASSQIGTLKKQIDNFELSKGLASDFAKEFKNIEHEIAELQRKTASGEINLIDAKAAEKEIDKIEKRWAFLLSKIGGESFLEKGLKTDAQAMAALESLAKSYASGIKEAEVQEAKLNKRLEEAKQKQKDIIEAQKEQKVVKASELDDQKAQLALLQQQEKTAKKVRDDAEKALRTKVEESGGKYSMDQATQKGSPLRKTDAYRTFREAQAAYDTAKAKTKTQKTSVDSMVTKEMQVAEATAAKEAIDKATEALENYRKTTLATAKEDAFEKAKESLKSIAEFKDIDWDGLEIDISSIKSVEDLEEALANLRLEADKRADAALKEIGETAEEASTGFKSMEKDIDVAKTGLQELDEQARQVDAFEARIKQFLGMAGAVELLRRALRQAFETTKELDAAMTEMAVVTDLEVGDYWKQLPDHTKRASELGIAIHSVYEAETLYYQQGLKTAEAQALANTTLKMARIAGLDAAEATDKMTAALRGFNMELNEASAEKVADVYSELAAITAADVDEISSAMTKTASIASSAGMEFETTAAFLSQIIETTRESAETAGTAMKTVIARFSEVKKLQGEGLLTGQDEEGEVIDVNKIQTALRTVGISMDEFFAGTEGLDSIFLKLAEKWDTLDVKTQRYIATTAAGSRQQSRFIAMMSDYARTQELVTAANNSAGASQEQYEKTLESLESKLAKLKNAWDEFSMGILQSDLVKFGVDALTKFLEIINKATSALDGMGGTVMKVLTTITLFKIGQKVFDKIKQPMMNFLTSIVSEVYEKGVEAGEAYAKGSKEGAKKVTEGMESEEPKKEETLEEKNIWQKASEKTGITGLAEQTEINKKEKGDFIKYKELKKEADKKTRKNNLKEAQGRLNNAEYRLNNNKPGSEKEWEQAQKEYEFAQEQLKEYEEIEKKVQKESQDGWNNVGKSLSKVGDTVSGVGIGMSLLGGVLSSMGLEEVGEGFATVGNWLTILGAGISAIGSIVPVVAKVLVAASVSVQAAWWWVVLIVAAVALLVVGIVALAQAAENNKLENRMKAAAEATEQAKQAAQEAKEAYDEMLSDRNEYDEMQKNLENLTYGTKEWKKALQEANQQVLELIQTYPDLAKYMSRGEDGQLTITDEGWDSLVEQQEKAITNTQNLVGYSQQKEQELKMEGVKQNFTEESKVMRHTDDGSYEDTADSAALRADLESIYLYQNSSLEEQAGKVDELAKKYGITTDQIKDAAQALEQNKDEIIAIAEETENINRANLTAQASEDLLNNEFGNEAIDAFANSIGSSTEDVAQAEMESKLKDENSSNRSSGEQFSALAAEYGVTDEMTGDNKHDTQILYAKMAGLKSVDDIPDALKDNEDAMIERIAAMQQGEERNQKIEEYAARMENLASSNKVQAQNIAGMLSDEGQGMTKAFAEGLLNEASDENGSYLNKDAVSEQAKALGFKDDADGTAVEKWAESLNKTTEELYKEIESNAKSAIKNNEKTFQRLSRALGKSDNEIQRFGNNINLTLEQSAGLADKMIEVMQSSGQEVAGDLKTSLDGVLDSLGEKSDDFTQALLAIDWQSTADWEGLQETLEAMGIAWTDAIENFVNQAKVASMAVDIVDLNKVANDLQNMYDTIKNINSGEQGRTFDEDTYKQIIEGNKDLASKFVQVGDEFHYIGTSMQDLAGALKTNSVAQLSAAKDQVNAQQYMQKQLQSFSVDIGSGDDKRSLSINDDVSTWSDADKRAFINNFQGSMGRAVINGEVEGVDERVMSYVTNNGKSLGMSLGSNYEFASSQMLDQYIAGLVDLANIESEQLKDGLKLVSDAQISTYTFDSAAYNTKAAEEAFNTGDNAEAIMRSKALQIQGIESGALSEPLMEVYSGLIEKLESGNFGEGESRESVVAELTSLQKGIDKSLETIIYNQEGVDDIIQLQNRVADILYDNRQKEIDALSDINDSVNEANEKITNQIQEQISEARRQRDNEKTEQNIADQQSQMAYLMADTSGGGALEALAINQQLQQDQQAYQDSLIDQALQKLSDDNAKAAEQRQMQIDIMQATLDNDKENGVLTRQAEAIVAKSLREINTGVQPLDTEMGQLIYQGENWANLSEEQAAQNLNAINLSTASAGTALAKIENATDKVDTSVEDGNKIAEDAKEEIDGKNLNEMISIIKAGYEKEHGVGGQGGGNADKREAIIANAVSAARYIPGGVAAASGGASSKYIQYKKEFEAAGGNIAEFDELVKNAGGSAFSDTTIEAISAPIQVNNEWDKLNMTHALGNDDTEDFNTRINGKDYYLQVTKTGADYSGIAASVAALGIASNSLVKYKNQLYYYVQSGSEKHALKLNQVHAYNDAMSLSDWKAYETGGLADFTGPAWLDGTKSNPELVLNARDTANFIQLKDILAEIMNGANSIDKSKTNSNNTNSFDIDINVESLGDDYDVEQLADKIRSMLYEDASYRNINAINLTR